MEHPSVGEPWKVQGNASSGMKRLIARCSSPGSPHS
jgi:hypothetical protein